MITALPMRRLLLPLPRAAARALKFKEYKLSFQYRINAWQSAIRCAESWSDLPALNMEPGDELYFYVQARDTHQQQSRTDVFTVAIQDTAELLSMDGVS
jgi:hypothetical protein